MHSELHDAVWGNPEINRGLKRIPSHDAEEPLSPSRHSTLGVCDESFAGQEERSLHHVEREAVLLAEVQDRGDVRRLCEAVGSDNPMKIVGDPHNADAIFIRNTSGT